MSDERSSVGLWMWVLRAALLAVFVALVAGRATGLGVALEPVARLVPLVPPTGFAGGLVAGTTGLGGGFVFVPVFDLLRDWGLVRITFHQNVGSAAVVQAFAAAMAALGWVDHLYRSGRVAPAARIPDNELIAIVFATSCAAVPTAILTALAVPLADRTLQTAFMIFALALGGALLVFAWAFRRVEPSRDRPELFDLWMFLLIGVAGGYVTAFFGLGIGEFLVVYLVFRKFPVAAAVAAGVAVAAVTVAVKAGFDLAAGRVAWELVIPAVPGALLGGFLARWAAAWLAPLAVKTVAALWIIAASLYMIIRALA